MIPIRDTIPCFNRPYVMWSFMAINIILFLSMHLMPEQVLHTFLYKYGMVAARYTYPEWAAKSGFPDDHYFSFVSSMFLHGGWLHIGMNMLFMWIFADNIEDRMGRLRFFAFYMICGLVGTFLQYYFNRDSTIPVIGASGALAGVMGAYFFLYPYARIIIWVPFFFPLLFEVPAIVFLGIWMIIQLHSATIDLITREFSDVAWWGHLGGFIAGMIIHPLFISDDKTPRENTE